MYSIHVHCVSNNPFRGKKNKKHSTKTPKQAPKVPCRELSQALVNQVNIWNPQKDCGDGQERCMYQLLIISIGLISEISQKFVCIDLLVVVVCQIVKVSPTHLELKHTSRRTSKTTVIDFGFIKSTTPFCKMRVS